MSLQHLRRSWRRTPASLRFAIPVAVFLAGGWGAWAFVTDLAIVDEVHDAKGRHLDQFTLRDSAATGDSGEAFLEAFEHGDEMFETHFNALDGVGANVGQGQRFTRIPRADLTAPGQWANHVPARATGPNATSCNSCHNQPHDDGSGDIVGDVHRDPNHTGVLASMIHRTTPHIFALGALQRVAEEMTADLQGQLQAAKDALCVTGGLTSVALSSKGVSFGSLVVTLTNTLPCEFSIDASGLQGISSDLVVRPFQWKGSVASVRDFVRGASHNEIGMQAVELVGDGVDGDFDGVVDEFSVGDITSLAVYAAAQPRPCSKLELHRFGLMTPLTTDEIGAIKRGGHRFLEAGCATCHVPALKLDDPTFSEPSQNPNFRDAVFPGGQDPVSRGVDPANPVTFDLTADQPDNVVTDSYGNVLYRLGALTKDSHGRAVVRLFGDLKRHDMGAGLAEGIDEVGTGASVFMTENLWGCASSPPYMHDGRATTLTEAILEHGGEAAAARALFLGLSTSDKQDLIAFLDSLVLYKLPTAD